MMTTADVRTIGPHQHSWQRSTEWAGSACSYCEMTYAEWATGEIIALTHQLADRDATIRTHGEEIERLNAALTHKTMGYCHADDGTHYSGCPGWEQMRDADLDRLKAQVATLEAEVADLTRARRLAEYDRLRQRQ